MFTNELLYKDLIYYEDESGKKNNIGVFERKNTKDTAIIYNGNDDIELHDDKIYPIELTNEILDGIEDLEYIHTLDGKHRVYIDKGDFVTYVYDLDWDGTTWLKIYLYDEKFITANYCSWLPKGCIFIGEIQYLHELQHFVNLMNTNICIYKIDGKVFGETSILKGNVLYPHVSTLESVEDYEKWKKRVDEVAAKQKEK